MLQKLKNALTPYMRFRGTLTYIRQRFAGNQYDMEYIANSGLTLLEENLGVMSWGLSLDLDEDPRYSRMDFRLVFHENGCFWDIDALAYLREGKPYSDRLEFVADNARPIVRILSRGIILSRPSGAEEEFQSLLAGKPVFELYLGKPVPMQQALMLKSYFGAAFSLDIHKAMRRVTGFVRHPRYCPLDSLVVWLSETTARHGYWGEAAVLLHEWLHRGVTELNQWTMASSAFLNLGLYLESVRCVVYGFQLDPDPRYLSPRPWTTVRQILPSLVTRKQWTRLYECLQILLPRHDEMDSLTRQHLLTAQGLYLYFNGDRPGALRRFEELVRKLPSSMPAAAALCVEKWEDRARADAAMEALTTSFPSLPETDASPVTRVFRPERPLSRAWEALFPQVGPSLQAHLDRVMREGTVRETVEIPVTTLSDGVVRHARACELVQDGPLRSVVVRSEAPAPAAPRPVMTAYPVASCGIAYRARVISVCEYADHLAGEVTLQGRADREVTVFLPFYHEHRGLFDPDELREFQLYGFARSLKAQEHPLPSQRDDLQQNDTWENNPDSPDVFDPAEFEHDEESGDAEPEESDFVTHRLRSVIDEMEWFTFEGIRVCSLVVPLLHKTTTRYADTPDSPEGRPIGNYPVCERDEEYRAVILVAEHALGDYVPKVGDHIDSEVWLHGLLLPQQPAAETAPSVPPGCADTWITGIPYDRNDCEWLDIQALRWLRKSLENSALIDSVEYIQRNLMLDPHVTVVTKSGHRFFVFLEYEGVICPEERRAKAAYAESKGMAPYFFVQVSFEDFGGHFKLTWGGLDELNRALHDSLGP